MNKPGTVEGERAGPMTLSVANRLPRGSRLAVAMAAVAIGASLMTWYAVRVERGHAGQAPKETVAARHAAASEMRLPPIELRRDVPVLQPVDVGTPPAPPPAPTAPPSPRLLPAPTARPQETVVGAASHAASPVPVLVRAEPDAAPAVAPSRELLDPVALANASAGPDGAARAQREPAGATAVADASLLPDRRWLLQKGSFLDCTLETAIDSTLPGLATCVLALDVFGADGRVVLMERGTRLVGEVHGDVHAGQNRVAVAWTDARTPAGVRLQFLSMATDPVGRAGVPGVVDRHTGERFGAAILMSFIDGAASAIAAREQSGGGVVYNAQPSRDIATEALRNSIGIPPTIRVAQGARIQVIVASDVSFHNVYRLSARGPG